MPNYNYCCRECDHTFDGIYTMDDRKIPLSEPCPNCEKTGNIYQVITAPRIVRGVSTQGIKVDDGFREVISKVKSAHKVNNIKDY